MVKYTVRLPNGNEYGPADLATLRAWRSEGRIGPDSWVWTEGAPDWVPLDDVFRAGTQPPQAGSPRGAGSPGTGGASKAVQAPRPAAPAARHTPSPRSGPAPDAAAGPAPGTRSPAGDRAASSATSGAAAAGSRASGAPEAEGTPRKAGPSGVAGASPPAASARPGSPARPAAAAPRPRPRPASPSGGRSGSGSNRWIWLAGAGVIALLALGAAAQGLLLPRLESWRAASRLQGEALPEGRYVDPESGLRLEAPGDWVLLRPDSSLLVAPLARARLAHATLAGRATLSVRRQPPGLAPLDSSLDEVIGERRTLVSGFRETGRSDAVLAGRPARQLTATWSEAGVEQQAKAIATRDAWVYVTLLAWGPASGGAELEAAFQSLGAALEVAGTLEQRIAQEATRLLAAFPELSRPSVELLLRLQAEGDTGPTAIAAAVVATVDRGLGALSREETQALRQIYAQVFEPLSDPDRRRLAAWQQAVRSGQRLDADEALAVREAVRASLAALPGETLVELQALNEKALFAGADRS